jgi:hypothetical protein
MCLLLHLTSLRTSAFESGDCLLRQHDFKFSKFKEPEGIKKERCFFREMFEFIPSPFKGEAR